MTGQRSVYWKPRFLAALCLAGLLLVSSANLPISPIQVRSANSTLAAPTTPTPVTTGAGSWLWQNPLPQGNLFTGIKCPSSNICYAAGGGGTILKTIDGGITWTSLPTGTFASFIDLSCPTITSCFAIDIGGSFYITSDGGATWTGKKSLSFVTNGLSCPSPSVCFVAGSLNKGYIAATTDGGNTWVTQVNDIFDNFYRVACPDINTCYAVGNGGVIVGTKDGGKNWTQQSYHTFYYLFYLSCPDINTCYATYSDYFTNKTTVAKTTDGGQNWSPVNLGTPDVYGGIDCPSPTVCYMVDSYYMKNAGTGGNANARLIRTSDGGSTWIPQFSIPNNSLGFLSCTDISNCIAVGNFGAIISITNNGASWIPRSYGPLNDLKGISCPTETDCVSVGISGTILTTSDMGTTWISQTSGITNPLKGVSCFSPSSCVAVGISGTILTGASATWISRTSGTINNLNGVSCPDSNNCYAVGNEGIILYSNDSGSSWNSQSSSTGNNLNAISCIANAVVCFVVGDNNTILTNSSGNWAAQPFSDLGHLVNLRSVSCPNSSACFSVADTDPVYPSYSIFVTTTNGGGTWYAKSVSGNLPLSAISCSNNTTCYAVGKFGIIFVTTDGTNWNSQIEGSFNKLYGISCQPTSSCTAVGEGGTILTNQLIVIKAQDNGDINDFGTLSYALNKAVAGQNIGFSVSGGVITTATSLNVKPGVRLYSNCASPVTLDFQNNAAISLNLSGQNTLQGIKIIHAAGTGIKATGTGNALRCTKIQR